MKKKNGFTLVELLAVIVVLAIIMIIAIPNVLKAMNNARKNSFKIEAQKFVKDVKTQYTADSGLGGKISGPGYYVYEMSREDIGYDEQGSYNGFVVIDSMDPDDVHYTLYMYDDNYQIIQCFYDKFGITDDLIETLGTYGSNNTQTKTMTSFDACQNYLATQSVDAGKCYAPNGYEIVQATGGDTQNTSDSNSSDNDINDSLK